MGSINPVSQTDVQIEMPPISPPNSSPITSSNHIVDTAKKAFPITFSSSEFESFKGSVIDCAEERQRSLIDRIGLGVKSTFKGAIAGGILGFSITSTSIAGLGYSYKEKSSIGAVVSCGILLPVGAVADVFTWQYMSLGARAIMASGLGLVGGFVGGRYSIKNPDHKYKQVVTVESLLASIKSIKILYENFAVYIVDNHLTKYVNEVESLKETTFLNSRVVILDRALLIKEDLANSKKQFAAYHGNVRNYIREVFDNIRNDIREDQIRTSIIAEIVAIDNIFNAIEEIKPTANWTLSEEERYGLDQLRGNRRRGLTFSEW